jgi:hypothetical protein
MPRLLHNWIPYVVQQGESLVCGDSGDSGEQEEIKSLLDSMLGRNEAAAADQVYPKPPR